MSITTPYISKENEVNLVLERIDGPAFKVGDRVRFRNPDNALFLFSRGNPDPHGSFVVLEVGYEWNRNEVYLRDKKDGRIRTLRRELELVEDGTEVRG